MKSRYVVAILLAMVLMPLAPLGQAGPALVHTFTGSVAVKHIVGGATACTTNGAIQIDVYTASDFAPVTNSVANVNLQAGQCYTAEEKYTATPSGKGWRLSDPITSVPGTLSPVTNSTGDIVSYSVLLIMRVPRESQSNFTQLNSTSLVETRSP